MRKVIKFLLYFIAIVLLLCLLGIVFFVPIKRQVIKYYSHKISIDTLNIAYKVSRSLSTEFNFPDLKYFDSLGNQYSTMGCYGVLDKEVQYIANDSLILTSATRIDTTLKQYLQHNSILDLATNEHINYDTKYKGYIICNWSLIMELLADPKISSYMIEQMRKASIVAEQNRLKLILLHVP